MDLNAVRAAVDAARQGRALTLVGIGGHGGAGKSSLATAIGEGQIVGTDEFWDGEGFDLARLEREVLRPLQRGAEARFASWDWASGAPGGVRVVTPTGLVIVEGVCALHRRFRDVYAVRIWVEAPYDLRLARGVARDGEAARRTWVERWIPAEERYVAEDDPVSCANLVVDGSGPPP